MYKIRNKQTGLFSLGGLFPTWSERGVRWTSMPQVRMHITEAFRRNPDVYREAEVVEIREVVVRVVSPWEAMGQEPGAYTIRRGKMVKVR